MNLYLQNVRIRNFRTFGRFDLDIAGAPGLIILTGPNGLGKTSFFDAIEWCLTSRVKRFERYFSKGETEADYLTREASDPFSHAVTLGFTDGDRVDREGSATGAIGSSDEMLNNLLVSPNWGQRVESLSTYLALTHFLGQGSQQRFMSREASEQWNALRVPSGVEHLEHIRKRLRGRSATIALNRKADAAAKDVNQNEDRLARWDALVERLRRLEGTAEAAGALPRDQIERATSVLRKRLALIDDGQMADPPTDLMRNLTELRTRILEADKALEAAEDRHMQMVRLPDQYADLTSRQSAVDARLASLRAAKRDSEQAFATRIATVERLDGDRRRLSLQGQRLREREAVLLAAQVDLRDADQAAQRQTILEKEISETETLAADLAKALTAADAEFAALQSRRDSLAVAIERNAAAMSLVASTSEVKKLESRLEAAQLRRHEAFKNASELSDNELAELAAATAVVVENRRSELADRRERAGAISAALTTISAHLTDHDIDCPLCKSRFPIGELKRLAEVSARESDEVLPILQASLDKAEAEQRLIHTRRTMAARMAAELHAASTAEDEARTELEALRSELLTRLKLVDPTSDLAAVAQATQIESAEQLHAARAALAPHEAAAIEMQQKRSQARERLRSIEAQLEDLHTGLSRAVLDANAAERRFHVRVGEEGLTSDAIAARLAKVQAEIDHVDAEQKTAGAVHSAETEVLEDNRDKNAAFAGTLAELEQMQNQLQGQIAGLTGMWSSNGMLPPPAHATFEQTLGQLGGRRSELKSVDGERARLVAALEATASREELNNVRRMVAAETGGRSAEAHRFSIEAEATSSRSEAARIKAAHEAILRLAERLQNEADSYSNQFLRPLNDLICAFNDALLTSPGTSVVFNADYFADRTEFSARIRRRAKIGTPPIVRAVNPQLILSEGQLAANGLSMLCSASVSYPWSTWRSLLLDDPLQHNDVIHAAAFTDMMRNLVGLKGYQVLMSSHDRVETEFVERKFSAASLPCTVLQLIADSPGGVSYEIRNNSAARGILQSAMRKVG